eukprot:6299580-Amphidinium_carterae.1
MERQLGMGCHGYKNYGMMPWDGLPLIPTFVKEGVVELQPLAKGHLAQKLSLIKGGLLWRNVPWFVERGLLARVGVALFHCGLYEKRVAGGGRDFLYKRPSCTRLLST